MNTIKEFRRGDGVVVRGNHGCVVRAVVIEVGHVGVSIDIQDEGRHFYPSSRFNELQEDLDGPYGKIRPFCCTNTSCVHSSDYGNGHEGTTLDHCFHCGSKIDKE